VPNFNFHLSPTHSVRWHFDRHPGLTSEELVTSSKGDAAFRLPPHGPRYGYTP
jgi:hypothetical protein